MPVSAAQLALDLDAIRNGAAEGLDYSAYNSYQLRVVFSTAVLTSNWNIAKDICELSGPKPKGASKQELIEAAIKDENWTAVYEIERVFRKEDYIPMPGPMPKSKYTMQMEEIARGLMRGEQFAFSKDGSEDVITVGGVRYNWTQVREHANFDHIDMVQSDFDLYKTFLDTNNVADASPNLEPDSEAILRSRLYVNYILEGKTIPEPRISFQEMQAINIYTGEFYSVMNRVLRGQTDLSKETDIHRAAIIHSVMAASGLRRIPETQVKQVVRGAKFIKELHETWVKAAADHAVVPFSGFVSTSTEEESGKWVKSGAEYALLPFADFLGTLDLSNLQIPGYTANVLLLLTNVNGVYIAPIAKYKHEQEFLIPPCHVQMKGYIREPQYGKHLFVGTMVTDLSAYHDEDYDTGVTEPSTTEPVTPSISPTPDPNSVEGTEFAPIPPDPDETSSQMFANAFSHENFELDSELSTAPPDAIIDKFEDALQEMEDKWIRDLESRVKDQSTTPTEYDHFMQATRLHGSLYAAVHNHFWSNFTNVEEFKKEWNDAINQAKPALQNIDSEWDAYLNSLQAASNWVSNIFSSEDFFAATKPATQSAIGFFKPVSEKPKGDQQEKPEPDIKPPS